MFIAGYLHSVLSTNLLYLTARESVGAINVLNKEYEGPSKHQATKASRFGPYQRSNPTDKIRNIRKDRTIHIIPLKGLWSQKKFFFQCCPGRKVCPAMTRESPWSMLLKETHLLERCSTFLNLGMPWANMVLRTQVVLKWLSEAIPAFQSCNSSPDSSNSHFQGKRIRNSILLYPPEML